MLQRLTSRLSRGSIAFLVAVMTVVVIDVVHGPYPFLAEDHLFPFEKRVRLIDVLPS